MGMNGINLRKQLEEDLTELKRMILRLGKMAEESVTRAVWALKNQDVEAARSVIEKDDEIDDLGQRLHELYGPVPAAG
jgi:phosphate transport system protein